MGKQSKHNKNKTTPMSYLDASTTPVSAIDSLHSSSQDPTLLSSTTNAVTNRVTIDPSAPSSALLPDPTSKPSSSPDRMDALTANIDRLALQVTSIANAVLTMQTGTTPRSNQPPSDIGPATRIDSRPPSAPFGSTGFASPADDASSTDDESQHSKQPKGQFNSNRFSVLAVDSKIKFTDMENYLSKRVLKDDSATSIEELYGRIVRSLNNAFSKHLQIMPSFRQLNRNTSFERLFLGKLFGSTRDTCQAIFDHLGDIIKEFLCSTSTIDPDRCPASYTAIKANSTNSGWNILESLLQARLAICGAVPDLSLDNQLTSLTLESRESYQSFYIRTQTLLDEFRFQATDDPFVPVPKIMKKYLQQLSRCPDYVPILMAYHKKLSKHIKTNGIDNNMYKLDFSLKDVHDELNDMSAPTIPSVLRDIESLSHDPVPSTAPATESFSALVASLESTVSEDCITPTICANVTARKRCAACLIGFHNEMDCYLRGSKFQPPNLQRRLQIYNKLNGDAPPPSHKIRQWDPPSLPPVHDSKNLLSGPDQERSYSSRNGPTRFNRRKPFSNTSTKTGKKEISLLDTTPTEEPMIIPSNDEDNATTVEPAIACFIQQQEAFEDTFDGSDHSFSDPIVCSAHRDNYNDPPISSEPNDHSHTNDIENVNDLTNYPTLETQDHVEQSNVDITTQNQQSQPSLSNDQVPFPYPANHHLRLNPIQRQKQVSLNEGNNDEQFHGSSTTATTTLISSLTNRGSITSDEYGITLDPSSTDAEPSIHTFATPSLCSTELLNHSNGPILNDAWNCQPIYFQIHNSYDISPLKVIHSIQRIHQKCNGDPNKKFLRHHTNQIALLPSTSFTHLCDVTFHLDGGANCGSIRDKKLFYFFISTPTKVKTVSGSSVMSSGWGGILCRFDDTICLVSPFYYCPNNPRNTWSAGLLMDYGNFRDAIVRTHKSYTMINSSGCEVIKDIRVSNDLDYIDMTIMCFNPDSKVIASAYPLRRSERLRLKENVQSPTSLTSTAQGYIYPFDPSLFLSTCKQWKTKNTFMVCNDSEYKVKYTSNDSEMNKSLVISNKVFMTIASLYVQLFQTSSPREIAIRRINCVTDPGNLHRDKIVPSHARQANLLALYPQNLEYLLPVIAKFSRTSLRNITPHQQWLLLHLGTLHASSATLTPIIKNNLLSDIPGNLKDIAGFDCTCWICQLRKAVRVPRGKLTDNTNLAPFQCLHVDFSFFNIRSIRGFTCGLDVACASTSYPFAFPTKSKSPPIDILRWLLNSLRSLGHVINFIRVDEGGELANSTVFSEFVFKNNCILQTTGGGNSTNNGKVERGNRTKADMIRAQLTTMNILMRPSLPPNFNIATFWCFVYCHTPFVMRRMFNRTNKDLPIFMVEKRRPSIRELVPLGSFMTIINPNKNNLPKLSNDRAIRGFFLGYGNHTSIRLYFDPAQPNKIKRSKHCIIEDMATLSTLQTYFQAPGLQNPIQPLQSHKPFHLTSKDFDTIPSAFPDDDIITFKLKLPTSCTHMGLIIRNDPTVGLPYLQKTEIGSYSHRQFPPNLRFNHYILSINNIIQYDALSVKNTLQSLQRDKCKYSTFQLVKCGPKDTTTSLVSHRTLFDQVPTLLHHNPTIAFTEVDDDASFSPFIVAPSKPPTPKSFFEALNGPHSRQWKAAAWTQYTKNKQIVAFSAPFIKDDLSPDARIFRSQLVCEVKPTDVPGVFQLKVRDVIVGTPQVKYIDFQENYAPTIDPTTIRIQVCFTCHHNYTMAVIDVKNAFQNTIVPPSSRIYTTLPPTYLEWLNTNYGESFDRKSTYLRQMLNASQGTRDAGCLFYSLLRKIVESYGFVRSTVDHAYFVKALNNGHFMYLSIATDDLLVSFPTYNVFEDFKQYLSKFFELSIQSGGVLKFLGVRYVQSDHCISLDQAEYAYDMVSHYFGTDVEKVKTLRTPMRYDNEYEKELYDAIPLLPSELEKATIKYKGAYRFWIGKFMYLTTQTRFEIGFAVQRLSEYNNAPTIIGFESIIRILRYLAGDLLRPLVYPKRSFQGKDTISWYAAPTQKHELTVTNTPALFFDAEFARDIATRRSYFCNVITIFNVAVMFKVKKTSSIMLHTTDSEMKGGSSGVRQLQPIRQLFSFNGLPLQSPTPAYTDNSAVHAIVESGRMTPRCRHIDIPIAYLHQEHMKSFQLSLIRTMVMLADLGTKSNTPKYHQLFKYWISGARFLPPTGHQHYTDLNMMFYEKNYGYIIKYFENTSP